MDVQTLTFIIVGATFALYIAIAIWARAGQLTIFTLRVAVYLPGYGWDGNSGNWMSAACHFVAGLISFMGYDGAVYLMGWTGGYVLLALFSFPRKFGKFTVQASWGSLLLTNRAYGCCILCNLRLLYIRCRPNAWRRCGIQPLLRG